MHLELEFHRHILFKFVRGKFSHVLRVFRFVIHSKEVSRLPNETVSSHPRPKTFHLVFSTSPFFLAAFLNIYFFHSCIYHFLFTYRTLRTKKNPRRSRNVRSRYTLYYDAPRTWIPLHFIPTSSRKILSRIKNVSVRYPFKGVSAVHKRNFFLLSSSKRLHRVFHSAPIFSSL